MDSPVKFRIHIASPRNLGISLIELLIGSLVFLGLASGAYQVFKSSTQKASSTQQATKQTRTQKQFFERFRNQIENTLQLPNSDGTQLRVKRPDRCIVTPDTEENIGWSLVPFPGKNVSEIPANFTPIDPSLSLSASDENDGIRMVYVTEDSVMNYLLFAGAPAVALPTTGNNPIVLDGAAKNLAVGDFAVISDAFRKDLIRITNITTVGSNAYIEHSSTKSIWNSSDLGHNYGGANGEYGQPVLFKVAIVTYALDSENNNLMVDTHIADDDFAPPSTWSAGLKQKWQAAAGGISKFQIVYVKLDESETRTPQAGIPGKPYQPCTGVNDAPNCGCGNELGNPDIKFIKVDIEYTQAGKAANQAPTVATMSEVFNPSVLKKGLPFFGVANTGGCEGDILYTTNDDGSPNDKCENPACLCSDRAPPGLCNAPCGSLVGPSGGWGSGGGAG